MARSERSGKRRKTPGSTTSLGKRRSLGKANKSLGAGQQEDRQQQPSPDQSRQGQQPQPGSDISGPGGAEYGSQASPMRMQTQSPKESNKVAVLGAAGGIGQPLALLLMLHCEYVHHLALYDLINSVRGVGLDLSHVDRQCKVTTHLGPDELAEAVRGAKVILVPAGLAQRPGMSRDDLFGSNAKIMYNLAKVCAQVAPDAMLAIITNPVNSLVPLACEVYHRHHGRPATDQQQQQQAKLDEQQQVGETANGAGKSTRSEGKHLTFHDCFRRIFGVTTLDVVRASSLTARSALFKMEPSGFFRDPSKLQVPVVGGHAGRTIMPLLSQATPKLDRKRLVEDRATTLTLIDSIQQAGIEVLSAKKGKGSATLAMAYAACRFTISLLRAIQGEQNIVECAYVRHPTPVHADLDYFAVPLLLGPEGYVRPTLASGNLTGGIRGPSSATSAGTSAGASGLLPFEEKMLEEGVKELRSSIAKGEDFARENLSAEK